MLARRESERARAKAERIFMGKPFAYGVDLSIIKTKYERLGHLPEIRNPIS
jgi:hypothetical protein